MGEVEQPDALTASLISDGSRCFEGLDLGMNSSTPTGVKSSACSTDAAVDTASQGWQHLPTGS
jgi:hypothetical protein